MSVTWIGERDQDMPRDRDRQKDGGARQRMTLQQAAQRSPEASRREQIDADDCDRKDDSDQALGEDVEGDGGGEGPAKKT
jgi:hypothetical protein